MIKIGDYVVTPTIFSDGSSQVWNLPDHILNSMDNVVWEFESEAEVMQIAQLMDLLTIKGNYPKLIIPYLPYGRQDKDIYNYSTFALHSFLRLLKAMSIFKIETYDVHSNVYSTYEGLRIKNIVPNEFIKNTIEACSPDLICLPDEGATTRGYNTQGLPSFNLDKKRNQLTGNIEGLTCKLPLNLEGKSILILDDITDRGGTFMMAAKLLKEMGAKEVNLYTTHGIYSGGTKIIFDSGISRIFNYKGEVK